MQTDIIKLLLQSHATGDEGSFRKAALQLAAAESFQGNAQAEAGLKLFLQSGCLNCHTYQNIGSSNLGAPDLTDVGTKHLGVDFQIRHLKCPSCVTPGSPMPSFSLLGDESLKQLAIFLEASKGTK